MNILVIMTWNDLFQDSVLSSKIWLKGFSSKEKKKSQI